MYSSLKHIIHKIHQYFSPAPLRYYGVAFLFIIGAFVMIGGKIFAETPASIYFEPGTSALPANQTLSLKVNSGENKVGFVRVAFVFDKNKITLTGEITNTPPFDTIIEKTSMSDANSLGAARLVVAVPPAKSGESPSGAFEIAQIPFHVVSTTTNDATVFIFDKNDIQIVDMENTILPFDIVNPAYTLNFVSAATPTNTSTPTATNTPTGTFTQTPSPTASATVTPTIQSSLTATPTQTATPSFTSTPTPKVMPSSTSSPTMSPTNTLSPTPSEEIESSPSPTDTLEPSPTIISTETPTPTPVIQYGKKTGWFSRFWTNFRSRFSFFFKQR